MIFRGMPMRWYVQNPVACRFLQHGVTFPDTAFPGDCVLFVRRPPEMTSWIVGSLAMDHLLMRQSHHHFH